MKIFTHFHIAGKIVDIQINTNVGWSVYIFDSVEHRSASNLHFNFICTLPLSRLRFFLFVYLLNFIIVVFLQLPFFFSNNRMRMIHSKLVRFFFLSRYILAHDNHSEKTHIHRATKNV